ncbi:MAG: hypothetical protein JO142_15290 [Burkholderiales bacterium]|nr:hypothetical protein [Burkholderiales bacterium]
MKQSLIVGALALGACSTAPPGEAESPIPSDEIERIAQVAAEARDSKDISQAQYEQTIKWLHASPCSDVDRSLSAGVKKSLAPHIAKHESFEKVEVLSSFAFGGWHIIEIETYVSDEPYLFYPADPTSSRSVAAWGGAATIFETADVEKWTVENAPGIPPKLASCFAWHVTLNRR